MAEYPKRWAVGPMTFDNDNVVRGTRTGVAASASSH